jgi:hypothetical protein
VLRPRSLSIDQVCLPDNRANDEVAPIRSKAMPVILTTQAEEALELQRPLPEASASGIRHLPLLRNRPTT